MHYVEGDHPSMPLGMPSIVAYLLEDPHVSMVDVGQRSSERQ